MSRWNWHSKRAAFMAVVTVSWVVSLFVIPETGVLITPYVMGLLGVYMGAESYRPSGVVEGILGEDK